MIYGGKQMANDEIQALALQYVNDGGDISKIIQELQNSLEEKPDLNQFHLKDHQGRIKGVYDDAIFRYILEKNQLFVLGGVVYHYDGGVYRPDISGAKLKTMIRKLIFPEFIKSTTIRRIYDLFISADELQRTSDQVNQYPVTWICFRNGMYDPAARQMHIHSPSYYAMNQLPHDFIPGDYPEGDSVERWLQFITPDPDDREMLLQYVGYIMTRDTRQQKFLILTGEAGTGKSLLIKLIEKVIGYDNAVSISLSELSQRFAAYGLLGKLLNSCADLEISALEDVSVLKKALGEDLLRAEKKGADAFPFKSYAKMLFSVNELPIVKSERTMGFYRRLLVLTMNRKPEIQKPDLFDCLSGEIDYFIHLAVDAVSRMYDNGMILSSEHSIDAVERLRRDSDSVEAFLYDQTDRSQEGRLERGYLHQQYTAYCYAAERQPLTKSNFFKALRIKGIAEIKSNGAWYFTGLTMKTRG